MCQQIFRPGTDLVLSHQTSRARIGPYGKRIAALRSLRGWGRHSHVRRCRKILAIVPRVDRRSELIGTPLPEFDREVVADGHVAEPIGAIFSEPDLAVLDFHSGIGVTKIFAAAIVAADLTEHGAGGLL